MHGPGRVNDKLGLNQDTYGNVLQERQHKNSFLFPMKSLNSDNIWNILVATDRLVQSYE